MNANSDSSSESLNRARQYHERIRTALLKEWDPIGVGGIEEAQDEYDSYVPAIYRLLITRRPQHEIVDYLWWLETTHMGLTGDRQATEHLAQRLLRIPLETEN
jgi:hypothetical protein